MGSICKARHASSKVFEQNSEVIRSEVRKSRTEICESESCHNSSRAMAVLCNLAVGCELGPYGNCDLCI